MTLIRPPGAGVDSTPGAFIVDEDVDEDEEDVSSGSPFAPVV